MARYRKKPIEIDAVHYDGTVEAANRRAHATKPELGIVIHTLEGDMTASVGDWIIQGVQGEFYPCTPDIFAATYEEAS